MVCDWDMISVYGWDMIPVKEISQGYEIKIPYFSKKSKIIDGIQERIHDYLGDECVKIELSQTIFGCINAFLKIYYLNPVPFLKAEDDICFAEHIISYSNKKSHFYMNLAPKVVLDYDNSVFKDFQLFNSDVFLLMHKPSDYFFNAQSEGKAILGAHVIAEMGIFDYLTDIVYLSHSSKKVGEKAHLSKFETHPECFISKELNSCSMKDLEFEVLCFFNQISYIVDEKYYFVGNNLHKSKLNSLFLAIPSSRSLKWLYSIEHFR